jgi:outer membrane receptor protein involved in Fe transport
MGLGSWPFSDVVEADRRQATAASARSTSIAFPFEAVERVEVLQDGASAIYGLDAIASVVNIIMRRDFDGLMLKGGYGVASRGDLPKLNA